MALKLRPTFKVAVEIDGEEGEFHCTFRKKKQNEALEDIRELNRLQQQRDESKDTDERMDFLRKMMQITCSQLVKVEGLQNEDGSEVTVEDFATLDVYEEVMTAVTEALLAKAKGKVDPEKKS